MDGVEALREHAHRRAPGRDPPRVRPDFRGHGLSDWPGSYGFEAFRDDLSAFIGALELGPVDVVGHSMGGAAAVLLAEQHPGLVRRLVIEDAPPLLPLDPPRPTPERPEGPPASRDPNGVPLELYRERLGVFNGERILPGGPGDGD